MKKGRAGTMTHDYKRNGTTTLFAALNVLDGTVIGRNMQRHRHQEFIRFLNAIEAAVPAGSQAHAILDNYAAHKHPKVRAWLDRHPRWTFHFVPTSCSWLNAVEGFFANNLLTSRPSSRPFQQAETPEKTSRQCLGKSLGRKPFQFKAVCAFRDAETRLCTSLAYARAYARPRIRARGHASRCRTCSISH
jgi:transposase